MNQNNEMDKEYSVVSECCPVGCSMEVVLIKSRANNHLYSYCDACGLIWQHPLFSHWEYGGDRTYDYDEDPRKHLPEGFALPTDDEIKSAGFAEFVLSKISGGYLEELERQMQSSTELEAELKEKAQANSVVEGDKKDEI